MFQKRSQIYNHVSDIDKCVTIEIYKKFNILLAQQEVFPHFSILLPRYADFYFTFAHPPTTFAAKKIPLWQHKNP